MGGIRVLVVNKSIFQIVVFKNTEYRINSSNFGGLVVAIPEIKSRTDIFNCRQAHICKSKVFSNTEVFFLILFLFFKNALLPNPNLNFAISIMHDNIVKTVLFEYFTVLSVDLVIYIT